MHGNQSLSVPYQYGGRPESSMQLFMTMNRCILLYRPYLLPGYPSSSVLEFFRYNFPPYRRTLELRPGRISKMSILNETMVSEKGMILSMCCGVSVWCVLCSPWGKRDTVSDSHRY